MSFPLRDRDAVLVAAHAGDQDGLVENGIDDVAVALDAVVDHHRLVAGEPIALLAHHQQGRRFRLRHRGGHLDHRLDAVVEYAHRLPWRGAGHRVVKIEVAQIFAGLRDGAFLPFLVLAGAHGIPPGQRILGVGKGHQRHEFGAVRAEPDVVGTPAGGDHQVGLQAHVERLEDQVLDFGGAGAAHGRFHREARVADVQVVDLLARLQGDVAHLQHGADDAGLLHAVDEAHRAGRSRKRLDAGGGSLLPALRDRQRLLVLRRQARILAVEIGVGRIVTGRQRQRFGCLRWVILCRRDRYQRHHRCQRAQRQDGQELAHHVFFGCVGRSRYDVNGDKRAPALRIALLDALPVAHCLHPVHLPGIGRLRNHGRDLDAGRLPRGALERVAFLGAVEPFVGLGRRRIVRREHGVHLEDRLALQGDIGGDQAHAADPVGHRCVQHALVDGRRAVRARHRLLLAEPVHLHHIGHEPGLAADVDHAAHARQRHQQRQHAEQLEHLPAGGVGRALVVPGAARGQIRVFALALAPAAIEDGGLKPLFACFIGCAPARQPGIAPGLSPLRLELPDGGDRFLVGGTGECHGQRPQCGLVQAAAALGHDVVLPLGNGRGDDLDLPGVEVHLAVQGGCLLGTRIAVGKVDLGGGRFDDHVEDAAARGVRQALGGQQDYAIFLGEGLEPLADLVAERRVAQHDPRFVDHDHRRLAVQAAFDAAEQVQQHRQRKLFTEVHQLLDLEGGEGGQVQAIFLGVEQVAHQPVHRVLPERRADILVLDGERKLGQGARGAGMHVHDGPADFVALVRRGSDAVERQDGVDPFHRPGAVALRVQELQRAEGQPAVIGGHREVAAAHAPGGRVHRHALVEHENRHAHVAARLHGDQRQHRGFAHPVHQRRRLRRIHRAWRVVRTGPDGAGGKQVGQVHGVDQRAAHVLHAVARQAAEKGVERVDGLDACGKADAVDGLFQQARGGIELVAVLVHQDHHAGVVALRDHAAVGFRDGRLGVGHHRHGVFVDAAGVGVEYLVEEAAHLLLPFFAELVEVRHRFVRVHENEARRPAVFARLFAQRGQDARRGLQRKALDGDGLHELAPDFWHDAAPHLLPADQCVQVHRVAGQEHGVVQARDTELQPAQKVVMRDAAAVLLHDPLAAQALEADGGGQARLDVHAFALEVLDQVARARLAVLRCCLVIEHQFDELALREQRWKVRHGQHEQAFVHGAQLFEQAAALLVHGGGERIREMRGARRRIAGGSAAHRIDVDHPAAAHAGQRLVQAERHHLALLLGAAGVVLALVQPGGHERAVLADDDAVIDHGSVVEQVGEAGAFRAMALELQVAASGTQPQVQQEQHHGAEQRDRSSDGVRLVAPVAHVHEAQLRIGLGHQPAQVQRAEPQQQADHRGTQFLRAENQRERHHAGKHHQLPVAAHEQVLAVAGPADRNRAQGHDHATRFASAAAMWRSGSPETSCNAAISAPRPKKVLITFCAPTSSAITSTRKIRVRKKPLRSPPKISTPPAMTMPMIESAKATGPVTELRRLVSQDSYGSEPPVPSAAQAGCGENTSSASSITANSANSRRRFQASGIIFAAVMSISFDGSGEVLAVLVAGNLDDFLDAAAFGGAGDMDNHVNHLADQRFNVCGRRVVAADQGLQAPERRARVVGVKRGRAALVAGVPGVEQVERFGAPHLANQDAVRPHAQDDLEQRRHRHIDGGVVLDVVLGSALDLADVFDDAHPLGGSVPDHLADDGVDGGGLAGPGTAAHQDIEVAVDGVHQRLVVALRHDARLHVLLQRKHGNRTLPDGERRRGDDGAELAGEARAVDRQLAFHQRRAGGDGLAERAGHGADQRLALRGAQAADAVHRFAQPFVPQAPVRVEHDLDRARVVQRREQDGSHVPFELALRARQCFVVCQTVHDLPPSMAGSWKPDHQHVRPVAVSDQAQPGTSLAGHSWIEYCPAGDNNRTFGTWGNDPVGKGNGLLEGLELGYAPTHSRTAAIDANQAARLLDVIARYAALGSAGWMIASPCSAFAAEAWEAATGERLAHRVGGISTPKTLAASIAAANQQQTPAYRNGQDRSRTPKSSQKNSSTPGETKPRKRGRRLAIVAEEVQVVYEGHTARILVEMALTHRGKSGRFEVVVPFSGNVERVVFGSAGNELWNSESSGRSTWRSAAHHR
uniref:Uncharacterized protein n=1 Tax=Tanacetum cinerariifolium TaxID=118510 RepID=A0A699GE27_TANCI|nr:hypothetical protein [Tanacetum cinerariifolium]